MLLDRVLVFFLQLGTDYPLAQHVYRSGLMRNVSALVLGIQLLCFTDFGAPIAIHRDSKSEINQGISAPCQRRELIITDIPVDGGVVAYVQVNNL